VDLVYLSLPVVWSVMVVAKVVVLVVGVLPQLNNHGRFRTRFMADSIGAIVRMAH
jgi:hypothetical protein